MSLNMSIRIILKIFLTIQLLLLIFRQIIDFAGIQWLMILVNAFAIIVSIAAFFGYLRTYGYFQIFLIIYNILIICIYSRVITLSVPFNENDEYSGTDFTATRTQIPATYLLSFDSNSRSFWYVIVSNHISELHSHISVLPIGGIINHNIKNGDNHLHHQHHQSLSAERRQHHQAPSTTALMDDSVVDLCVQYIEIAIAALHIFFSLLALGLILLKYKLKRDKLFRNNDKTTPPLPPYTISPQMNHYMSFTPQQPFIAGANTSKNSLYTSNSQHSLRRTSKRRRSTRSLGAKSKANSMGALNIRASSGSLRSLSKQSHRKSATSLLNDTSCSNNSNTMGSRGGANKSKQSIYQPMLGQNTSTSSSHHHLSHHYHHSHQQQQHQQQQHQPMINHRHSTYLPGPSSVSSLHHQNNVAKFLTSDSETDGYYQTFTPHYNALQNPLYGNRSQYMHDSETAI